MRASRSGVGGRGPSFPLARSSSPSRSPLLGSTMADRLPSLTSAPSLPDLPLSTLTSALTSLFLPHPPAAGLGSASAPPRHRRRDALTARGRMRRGGRASGRPRVPTFSVLSADSFYAALMLQGAGQAASSGRLARAGFCRTLGRKAADGDSNALLKSRRPAVPSWRLTGRRQGRSQ
ncbi:PREDICTED: uncharacterized protein LOC108543161 [Rhinopithecus bieti]|uniref:uncharacterized protein LOC108543161 n=1 Tax=Rhinopithecus bieti TaxID=61621 RepID=UPI00083BF447|nr:PREDICTED: uncharacterized protein LOC108543161 [Rhinopithecus bieti]